MPKMITVVLWASGLLGAGLRVPLPPAPRPFAGPGVWQSELATPGLNGMVQQILVPPDGHVVAAGTFTFAGPDGRLARTLARWDGTCWQPLGGGAALGAEGYVFALARTPAGDLLAAGRPHGSDASRPAEVLRYHGTHWQRLGSPTQTAHVWTLAVLPTGEVLAGSGPAGPHPGTYGGGLLHWTGSTWQPYAPVPAGTELRQVLVTRKGELLVAGSFRAAATGPALPAVARWTGQRWQRLGTNFNAAVLTLAETASGSLLVGGEFTEAGGAAANRVARWDGTAWRAMSTGFNGPIQRLLVGPTGEVVANGEFTQASGNPGRCIARWENQRWVPLTPRDDGYCKQVLAVLPGGDLLGANSYGGPGGYYKDLVRYRTPAPVTAPRGGAGTRRPYTPNWLPVASPHTQGLGSDCDLTALAATASGELALSGYMQLPGTGSWQYVVAHYNGHTWQPLWGLDGRHVLALLFQPGGELVVGGLFPMERRGGLVDDSAFSNGASRCRYVARWDGRRWQPLGGGAPGPVLALARTPTGQVLAGGTFGVARWEGGTWQPLGAKGTTSTPTNTADTPAGLSAATALAVTPTGDLYAANALANRRGAGPATYLARWDGTTWQPVGEGLNGPVASLAVAPNGDLLASGGFGSANAPRNACSVARWNGREWQYLGPPLPQAAGLVTVLASGTVVLAGHFALPGSPRLVNLARWNGTAWEPLAGGLNDYAAQLVAVPGGGLAVAGRFTATADSTQSLGHVGVYRER